MGAASFGKREIRRVDIYFQVVIPDFILVPIAANVVRNVGPRSQTVDLGSLQEEKLFVGAPFLVKYGKRILLNDSIGMRCWLVGVARGAVGKTLDTEIVLIAGTVGAPDADLSGG